MKAYSSILINEDFKWLVLSHVFVTFGNSVRSIVIPWIVELLGGTPFELGLAFAFSVIDVLLFPIVGCVVDVVSRKRVMVFAEFTRNMLYLSIAYLYLTNALTIYRLYLIIILSSFLMGLFYNARFAAIPTIVNVDELDKANSIIFSLYSIVGIASILLSGILTTIISAGELILLASALGIIGSIVLLPIKLDNRRTDNMWVCVKNVKREFKVAIDSIRGTIVKYLIITGVLINLPAASFTLLLATIGLKKIGNPLAYSIFLSSILIGDIFGNWLQNKVSWSWKRKYYRGIALTGFSCIILGVSNLILANSFSISLNLYIAILTLLIAIIGLTKPFFNVPSNSLIQSSVNDNVRGKVATFSNSLFDMSFIPSYIITGWLLLYLSPFDLFIVYGLILIAIAKLTKKLVNKHF
mgnify:CR=1 FL=1